MVGDLPGWQVDYTGMDFIFDLRTLQIENRYIYISYTSPVYLDPIFLGHFRRLMSPGLSGDISHGEHVWVWLRGTNHTFLANDCDINECSLRQWVIIVEIVTHGDIFQNYGWFIHRHSVLRNP